MTKKELLEISFEKDNEKMLKSYLIKQEKEYGFNKAFLLLAVKNQILLNSYDIDENSFNQMLFKNYIYSIYDENKIEFEELDEFSKEIINIFNFFIETNNLEEALYIYKNYPIIYQILCTIYIRNLYRSEENKINKINNENIDNIYNKISLLNNTDLSFKREENVKALKKVSQK